MSGDARWYERVALWLSVLLVAGLTVWCNLLHARLDVLNAKLVLVAGESKSAIEWAQRSDAENASLRYLRPLATKYGGYRKTMPKKEAAEKAAAEWK